MQHYTYNVPHEGYCEYDVLRFATQTRCAQVHRRRSSKPCLKSGQNEAVRINTEPLTGSVGGSRGIPAPLPGPTETGAAWPCIGMPGPAPRAARVALAATAHHHGCFPASGLISPQGIGHDNHAHRPAGPGPRRPLRCTSRRLEVPLRPGLRIMMRSAHTLRAPGMSPGGQ
jgi:hypothetical protein